MKLCPKRPRIFTNLCILSLLIGYCFPLQAQEYFASVKNAKKEDQYKIACNIYYQKIANLDPGAGLTALSQLEKLANDENNDELRITFLALMGDFYKERDKGDSAISYLKQAYHWQ